MNTLTTMQVDNAFNVLDFLGVSDPSIETAKNVNKLLAIAALGATGVAVIKIVAKKFSSLSKAARFNEFRTGLFGDLRAVGARSRDRLDPPAGGTITLTSGKLKGLKQDEVYIYVVDASDNMILAIRGSAGRSGVKHTQLTGGDPAKAAGELRISGGQVQINNQSGRYSAQAPDAINRVRGLLQSEGFPVTITGAL